ncbi:MAG: efflux RND transporter periplasmic adaptor subunit [Sulfurospirillaceae bacterium]|nr:efflux RND transporter periplasmic adaptor subunit [Sulfurospirillaceae bacterium]
MEDLKKVVEYKGSSIKWKFIFVIFLIMIGVGGYFLYKSKTQNVTYHYVTQPLKDGNLTITVSATGNIQPMESVQVGTEVSGTIEKVFVYYNDKVKKGEPLAQLDKTKYLSNLNQAKASLQASKASLENMNAKLNQASQVIERDKSLKKSTKNALPSKNDWDTDWANYLVAKAQVANAKAQVNQAKQVLSSSQYDYERTTIYSPIDGTILIRNIDPGQTVAASFQTPVLFQIAKDLTKMQLQVNIDEADIAKVKAGQDVTFSVDAYPNRKFKAKVNLVRVNSVIVDGVVTYIAEINFDNSNLLLKPGMSADAEIVTKNLSHVFIVPRSAMLYIPINPTAKKVFGFSKKEKEKVDQKPHVWILKNNKPEKVYVKELGNSGSDAAISSDGLHKGDPIIVMQEKSK